MSKRIKPSKDTSFIGGSAVVVEVFRSSKFGNIAGVNMERGTIRRGHPVTVIRTHTEVATDLKIESLRQFSYDVELIDWYQEGGIGLGAFSDIQIGDLIIQHPATLEAESD